MRRTPRRLLGRPLAAALAAAGLLGLLTAVPQTAPAPATEPVAADGTTATVFYSTKTRDWSAYHLHYAPDGGSWTTVPGTRMQSACADWVKLTVPLGGAAGLQATFTDGSGTWDNNAGRNYDLGTGNITVKDGVVAHSDPCTGTGPEEPDPGGPNTASVYYATSTVGWSTVNLHYRPHGGAWTAVPGSAWRRPAPAGCGGRWTWAAPPVSRRPSTTAPGSGTTTTAPTTPSRPGSPRCRTAR